MTMKSETSVFYFLFMKYFRMV